MTLATDQEKQLRASIGFTMIEDVERIDSHKEIDKLMNNYRTLKNVYSEEVVGVCGNSYQYSGPCLS